MISNILFDGFFQVCYSLLLSIYMGMGGGLFLMIFGLLVYVVLVLYMLIFLKLALWGVILTLLYASGMMVLFSYSTVLISVVMSVEGFSTWLVVLLFWFLSVIILLSMYDYLGNALLPGSTGGSLGFLNLYYGVFLFSCGVLLVCVLTASMQMTIDL